MSALDFELRLPPDWMVLETEGERIPVQLARLLDDAEQRDPAVQAHRGMVEKQLRAVLRNVRSQDLSFCAMLATVVEDVLPMYATLTGALRGRSGSNDVASILSELQRKQHGNVKRIPIGELVGVRAAFRTTVSDEAMGQPIEAAVWQYFIPSGNTDGGADRVAVLTASTPMLMLEQQFGELFDAIVATFRFKSPAGAGREAS